MNLILKPKIFYIFRRELRGVARGIIKQMMLGVQI